MTLNPWREVNVSSVVIQIILQRVIQDSDVLASSEVVLSIFLCQAHD
jgi:hypothetical protein